MFGSAASFLVRSPLARKIYDHTRLLKNVTSHISNGPAMTPREHANVAEVTLYGTSRLLDALAMTALLERIWPWAFVVAFVLIAGLSQNWS
jgi:hypothetical protein